MQLSLKEQFCYQIRNSGKAVAVRKTSVEIIRQSDSNEPPTLNKSVKNDLEDKLQVEFR